MEKLKRYDWWILVVALFLLAFTLRSNQNNQVVSKETFDKSVYSENEYFKRDYEKEFLCDEEANVWQTECLIEKLDRAAAIREWKQRKIEVLKHPEVNIHDLSPELSDEVETMKKWRAGFEDSRDEGCVAEYSFRGGSGFPGLIAECELNYEISALKALDKIYYESILGFVYGSKGIPDFEPDEKDIEELMKSNKTERGCVWADDPACE